MAYFYNLLSLELGLLLFPTFPPHPPEKQSLKDYQIGFSYFGSSIKVSLKETTTWVGILIIPLKRLNLMFKSLTFQICRIVMFKILIKILATLRLCYRVKTSRVFTSVYNAFCILYLWDITLFSHGVGILMILNTFSCMMLMSTGQLWSSYKVNQVWYAIICWCGEPVLYVYDKSSDRLELV